MILDKFHSLLPRTLCAMFPIDLSFLSSLLDSYLLVIFSYSWFSASETEGEREQVDGSINGPEINCLI